VAQKRGLIQVYTGQGKGKTTAALGLALRAAGHGLRVEIVQFLKGWPGYGELKGVDWLPTVAIHAFGRSGWIHPDHPEPEDFDRAANALAFAHQLLAGGDADIVILDEVNVALDYGLLSLADLLGLLDAKPPAMELILTGRNAPPALIQRADLVTEMRLVKHPYDQGIKARRGVEF
jgi:cob(I)alamin adenosyltransferase